MKSQTTKLSTEQVVMNILADVADATTVEIAAAGKLGRSTVSKTLVKLASAGKVKRILGRREVRRRLPDRWSLASRAKAPRWGGAVAERLRPGELDGLVLDYMREHSADGPLGPTAVAKSLGRSSGAVANCLNPRLLHLTQAA